MSAASSDQDGDAYASDDYEPESPAHSQPSPTHFQPSSTRSQVSSNPPSPVSLPTFRLGTDTLQSDESDAGAVAPLRNAKSKRRRSRREIDTINGRHLIDNTPWTYSVSAFQVRMLRIPVSESAAIHELRVFATIDKHAVQSRGSRWKHEMQSIGGPLPLRSTKKRESQSKSPARRSRTETYRRSGLIEEAKWVRGDGKLQWTFPMEKFRRLKAYAPRIKAYVYGLRDAKAEHRSHSLALDAKDGAILSFGWFFLDLRTPDLPERWLKLQNSPFGGEILISSTFSPVELSSGSQGDDNTSSAKRVETVPVTVRKVNTVPTVVAGESGEYLQIGENNGQDVFVLSVFIQTALNLTKVVSTSMGEDRQELERVGFWFSYSLFDVVVQTDVFYNLDVAEFPPIRDSFRVKSCLKDLACYIKALGGLTVFMCTENRVLAGVEIPLYLLLSKGLFLRSIERESKPRPEETSEIDGNFSFSGFDDALISASVAVEFVESSASKADEARHSSRVDNAKEVIDIEARGSDIADQGKQTDITTQESQASEDKQMLLKLGYMRLKTSILAQFLDKESLLIEVEVGEEKMSGDLTFCSFTKQQAFAISPALGVLLENISGPEASILPIRVRCFSSASNQLVASSAEAANVIHNDEGYPKLVDFSLLNDLKQPVGQCMLDCTHGPDARQKLDGELSSNALGETRQYRICLLLKSIRDVEIPGGYFLRYQNPFLSSASVVSEWFTVQNKGEVATSGFYCVSNLTKNPLELKEEMQKSVNIDLVSSDDERVGSATFSLSYLFFSEEQFCCAEDNCDEIFMTQTEAQAHWLDVHTERALPDVQSGPEAYSHSYRSCSINLPIVGIDEAPDPSQQQSPRVGFVRVSAYLEDTGLLTESRATARGRVISLPPSPLQDRLSNRDELSVNSHIAETPVRDVQERKSSMPLAREVEETRHCKAAATELSAVEGSGDNLHAVAKEVRGDQARENEIKAAQFRETLEREKVAWRQEQQLQQLQWKRRFAEMEKARMDELEEEWARREEERSNLLKSAQEEYQQLEQTIRKSLADLETRERQLSVAEAALKREQEAKREENESLQRRLKSEQHHTQSLAKKQTEAYERRITLLETQLREAEQRAKQVENDFAEYRQQQRKLPEFKLREEIAALKGSVAELEKQKLMKERECEIAEANAVKMKDQLQQMHNLLAQEKKKHEAQVVDELEKLRVKYIAREEKYVLDGDRDELRAIKKQLDDLKGFKSSGSSAKKSSSREQPQDPASPQHRRNHWHTQNRRAGTTHQALAPSQPYGQLESSSDVDHASDGESDWETSSYVEICGRNSARRLPPDAGHVRELSIFPSPQHEHKESFIPVNAEKGDESLDTSIDTYVGPPGTELERLVRERQVLLTSGSYDTQSYVVRELDRLIRATKASAERHNATFPVR